MPTKFKDQSTFMAMPTDIPMLQGLTKREYFSAMAMHALLSNYQAQERICEIDPRYDGTNFAFLLAHTATDFADELLERLAK